MASSVYFNGELITIPGAYSKTDASGMSTKSDGDGAKIIAFIGESTGGEPATVQFFTEPTTAKKVLKSGDLLKACEKAWNPVSKTKEGMALGGANIIACIRSNKATKSSYTIEKKQDIKDASKIAIPDKEYKMLDKLVSAFVKDGGRILEDGTVMATMHYVKGFKEFNSAVPAEQNGYYFPCLLNGVTGTKMTLKKNGEARSDKTNMDFDPELLFRVQDKTDTFTVEVDGTEIITLNFQQAVFGAENEKEVIPKLRFVSTDWGENTAHQLKMASGALSRTKKLTIYDQNNGTYENYNDVGNVFTISYTGNEPYAELNIFKDSVTGAMYFQTKIGASKDDCVEDLKIKLDKTILKNIKALVQQIMSYENYYVDATERYNNRLIVTDLDYVEGANIITKQGDTAFRVTAVYADLQKKLAVQSQLVNVDVFDKTCGEIENFDYVTMEGGTAGISPASWVEYFDMLSNFDITYIVPLVSDNAIHAELLSHVTTLSGSMGRERRGIIGGENYETVAETLARARDMSSDRIQVVHGGFWDYNAQNELELYPPYILAAQHAGRAAFLEDGESATRDVYRMTSPEYKLERTEITQLLDGGVLAFEFVLGRNSLNQSYVRLVQDLTTDTTSTDTIHTERATGALADSINKEIRDELDNLLTGKRTSKSDLTSAKNRVLSILFHRKNTKNQIIDYKDVYVTKTGTATTVEYSVAPAEPNNFTLITGHYYSESISADGSNVNISSGGTTGGRGVNGAEVM